jgi:alpha-1,6-mannosyltransferase
MRFIFPALPILNLAAASAMARLFQLAFPEKEQVPTLIGRLGFIAGIFCLLMTMVGNLAFVAVSRWNYPGGDALLRLSDHVNNRVHNMEEQDISIHVHIDVASSMSWVSLFGQRAAANRIPGVHWTFDKGGYEEEHSQIENFGPFTHLLSEENESLTDFEVIGTLMGTPRLAIRQRRIETLPSIYILERKGFWDKVKGDEVIS